MNKIIKFWFFQVSRGYSLPMSLTNWLVVFALGLLHAGNALYGTLALIGFMCAHLGTNVFDDFVDHKLKTPKQKYKSRHLDTGETNLKTIFLLAIIYFAIALLIGIFLFIKCGWVVLALAGIGGIIALLYPFSNKFALGELAVGSTFGPMLFMGVYYVMTGRISEHALLISIPVAIFTVVVLMVHALMDYDFDKTSGKRTLCILAGDKAIALNMIFAFIVLAFAITIGLIGYNYLPIEAGATFGSLPVIFVLYKRLNQYISTDNHANNEFIINFNLASSIGTIYCLVVAASFFIEKFIA